MSHARFHAKKYSRRGPLFMDRYKSIVTQDQRYLQELLRYVYLNPIRAGMAKDLDELEKFPWSGDGVLMGRYHREFQDADSVFRCFGETKAEARKFYRRFMREGLEYTEGEDTLIDLVRRSNAGSESVRKPSCWVIGDHAFVRNAIKQSHARRFRIARFQREGLSLDDLARRVSAHYKIEPDLITKRQRGGNRSDARKAFAFLAVREFGVAAKDIAQYLGTGPAAVSTMVQAGIRFEKNRRK
jgi:hypothetical protein